MVGKIQEAAIQIQNFWGQRVYRIWSGAHQLDLAEQAVFNENVNESFTDLLSSHFLFQKTN